MNVRISIARVQVGWLRFILLAGSISSSAQQKPEHLALDNVFDQPAIHHLLTRDMTAGLALGRQGKVEDMEAVLTRVVDRIPDHPLVLYNLACAKARLKKDDEALDLLEAAVEAGMNQASKMREDGDLASLRDLPRFDEILERAADAAPFSNHPPPPTPSPVKQGWAWVTEDNTGWDGRALILRSLFDLGDLEPRGRSIRGESPAHDQVRSWLEAGRAAGNAGTLYDNRDRGHSSIDAASFAGLTPIRYGAEAKWRDLDFGIQLSFFYNAVVLGNASIAMTGAPQWRSMARRAYVDPRAMRVLYAQYRGNQLYVYPEHEDHDPGHNGKPDGYGDVFCANTPYVVISQGSSRSDRPFLSALALTLAAFRPDVKEALTRQGLLMPTLQMVLRSSLRSVTNEAAYLAPSAHPTVFDGKQLAPLRMVRKAQEMTPDRLPPLAVIDVVEEDQGRPGVDYFHATSGEALWTTPHAVARVVRSMAYQRRLVVSARQSTDPNDRPLTYQWVVLRGNRRTIEINPVREDQSVVELVIPYHPRAPVKEGAALASNRVDIGLFVHNGVYYSAPAFVCLFYLDNEDRTYDEEGRIQSVQYAGGNSEGNYVDPMIDIPKDWRDAYHYDADGTLQGWTRTLAGRAVDFDPQGRAIVRRDDQERAAESRPVHYLAGTGEDQMPVLIQVVATPAPAP